MKNKYIFALVLFVVLIVATYFASAKNIVEVKEVLATANLKGNCSVTQINEDTEYYTISAYYPITKYDTLNKEIKKYIDDYIKEFKDSADGTIESDSHLKRALEIKFDCYEYESKISYVFNIFSDLGGAHPNTYIWTISYDTKTNKIINIEDLVEKNKDILKILSDYTYGQLKNDTRIKEVNAPDMLKDGTKPLKENFNKFAFDKSGLIIFFEKYSVAPYVAGEFSITVPYDKINI